MALCLIQELCDSSGNMQRVELRVTPLLLRCASFLLAAKLQKNPTAYLEEIKFKRSLRDATHAQDPKSRLFPLVEKSQECEIPVLWMSVPEQGLRDTLGLSFGKAAPVPLRMRLWKAGQEAPSSPGSPRAPCPGSCQPVLGWSGTAGREGTLGGHFGRAKASPAGLQLGHASPAVLTSCLGQDSKITWLGRALCPRGSSHCTHRGLMGQKCHFPPHPTECPEQGETSRLSPGPAVPSNKWCLDRCDLGMVSSPTRAALPCCIFEMFQIVTTNTRDNGKN